MHSFSFAATGGYGNSKDCRNPFSPFGNQCATTQMRFLRGGIREVEKETAAFAENVWRPQHGDETLHH